MIRSIKKGFYKHFKGNEYEVLCVAKHTETGEELTIYKDMNDQFKIWARPLGMFLSKVDKVKYPEATQECRFEFLRPQKKTMRRVYVAHPYGGDEANRVKVEKIIRKLTLSHPNTIYISPIHAVGYLYNDVTYDKGMEYCFELLGSCDEILLCPGWEKSEGCNREKKYSTENHIPIYYIDEEVELDYANI